MLCVVKHDFVPTQRRASLTSDLRLPVWLSGNALFSINLVALRRARLVPGWVTASGRLSSWYVTSHPGRQSLLLCRTVKLVSASGLSNNINGDGG